MLTAIINAKVVLPESIIDGSILIENGKILAVGDVLPPKGAQIIDVKGAYAGPGYVDIHCHEYVICQDPSC
jgi:N-acetylglucosamine-6-phosphate deacetylase